MKKRRIIINIYDETITDEMAVRSVANVISQGRISNIKEKPQYCFVTTWKDGTVVYAKEKYNTDSDIFNVWKDKNK